MDEIERMILKKNVDRKIDERIGTHKPFETLIKVYVGMQQQKDNLENKLETYTGNDEGRKILQEALQELEIDLSSYKEELLI